MVEEGVGECGRGFGPSGQTHGYVFGSDQTGSLQYNTICMNSSHRYDNGVPFIM